MVVVPLTKGEFEPGVGTRVDRAECTNWIRYAAAGTLAASGVLLVTGQRRLGLVTALSGAALALIDQQDAVRKCWDKLPEFLEDLQGLLSKTQAAVEDLSSESQKLRQVLSR
jgi:ABC-type transporter Mla subunit MlaD